MRPAILDIGEIKFREANGLNVPVSIFVSRIEDDEREERLANGEPCPAWAKWQATADAYQPRRALVLERNFLALGGDRDRLVRYVQRYTIPLYEYALGAIRALGTPGSEDVSCLYYWSAP